MITGQTARYRVQGTLEVISEFYLPGYNMTKWGDEYLGRLKVDRMVLADDEWEAEREVSDDLPSAFYDWQWVEGPMVAREEIPEDERMRLLGAVPLLECD